MNNPAGKYRLKALFPNNGIVNQGNIIIKSHIVFEYFITFIKQPPVQSHRNNVP